MRDAKALPNIIVIPQPHMSVERLVSGLCNEELLAIIHEICASSPLPIAEVREIVNSEGYND